MFLIITRDQITGHFQLIEREFATWQAANSFAESVATGDQIEPNVMELPQLPQKRPKSESIKHMADPTAATRSDPI